MELLDADGETMLLDTVYDYQPDYPDDASWPDFNKMKVTNRYFTTTITQKYCTAMCSQ